MRDAEEAAGFPVATVDLPEAAALRSINATDRKTGDYGRIEVMQFYDIGDAVLLVHQSPSLQRVLGEEGSVPEPIVLDDGREATVIRYGVTSEREQARIVVHYRDGDMGYAVVGILDDGLTEQDVIDIASTLRVR